MWYRQGAVTVTNGSNVVTGAGTDFVANASIGDAFIGPDGRSYEIAQIVSATDLRIVTGYQAATGGGQGYAIQPTQSFARDLALAAANLLNTFAFVRDGVGQGLFGDGAAATPAIRFSADQDTGLRRLDANRMSLVAGGIDTLIIGAAGVQAVRPFVSDLALTGVGTRSLSIESSQPGVSDVQLRIVTPDRAWHIGQNVGGTGPGTLNFYDVTSGAARMTLDKDGNLLVGVQASNAHHIGKLAGQGAAILRLSNANFGFTSAVFYSVGETRLGSTVEAAMSVGTNPSTGRSLNAGGTVNASGADYAEYMIKAVGCGLIGKGDVCGVDHDGRLTKTWADAISFVVKSTDPSLVGGDTWAAHLPPRPEAPGAEPEPPVLPTVPEETADDAEVAAYRDALAAYPALVTQYQADHDTWAAATAAYERDLPAWQENLEAARICVDRIAFCGQVPCNVTGDFEVGDYIVAVANGAGIKAVAMKLDDMSLTQYARRIGKVWAIRDGRAWIDVQHG